ncbi:MAG TPA: hypothetical protein VHJ20_23620 [Polyangia bacterium]|nr:hypothetical protein [Polyangia bacterium]
MSARGLLATTLALASCAWSSGPRGARAILPTAPAELGKCRVAASQSSPLVTEWPASEKANLEVLSRSGAVAVAYSGCSLRVLPECRVRGGYRWQRSTPATDSLQINDSDDLYAKLPLGAASLEGELKRAGQLGVKTVVSGQLRLVDASLSDVPADGACAQATHLVTAMSVGAFELTAGGSREGSANASVTTFGEAKLDSQRAVEQLRSAGDFAACAAATDESPNANCASPVQVFLTPLPGRAAEEGPPGTVKVDFLSANPSSRWDVYADDQVICTTPCARFVHPAHPVMLRTRDDGFFWSHPDKVEVASFLAYPDAHLQLQAHPTSRGELSTGIIFTTFSGAAIMSGAALMGVGCSSSDHRAMCTAGIISGGVGAVGLAGSLWLLFDAMPKAEIAPYTEGGSLMARRGSDFRWHLSPGGAWGTF